MRPIFLESSDPNTWRAGLTLLSLYKGYCLPPEVNTESITSRGPAISSVLLREVASMVKEMKLSLSLRSLPRPKLEYTSKHGPNGPALETSYLDLKGLNQNYRGKINLYNYLDLVSPPDERKE